MTDRTQVEQDSFVAGYRQALLDIGGGCSPIGVPSAQLSFRTHAIWSDSEGAARASMLDGGQWLTTAAEVERRRQEEEQLRPTRQAVPGSAKGDVYLLRCSATNRLKIGFTSAGVATRKKGIEQASGLDLEVVAVFTGTRRDETSLLTHF